MASATLVPFAPAWLRCAGCVLAMVPFVGVSLCLAMGVVTTGGLVALPFTGLLCMRGLRGLVEGRFPPAEWQVAARSWGAYVKVREH